MDRSQELSPTITAVTSGQPKSLRELAAEMGVSVSDISGAEPWREASVRSYAERHGNRSDRLGFAHLPDVQIASAVRMLMRDDLDHEAVVCAARDRICALFMDRTELLGALKACLQTLADFKVYGPCVVAGNAAISKAEGK